MGRWKNNPHKPPFSKYQAIQKVKSFVKKGLENLDSDELSELQSVEDWYGSVMIAEMTKRQSFEKRFLREMMKSFEEN